MTERNRWIYVFGLVLVTVFWGLGFPLMKMVSESFSTFHQIGYRFALASFVLIIIFYKKLRQINARILYKSFILSMLLFATYVFATLGIERTLASRAAFFSCIAVLIVPIILVIAYRKKLEKKIVYCVLACGVGLFLVSYSPELGFSLNSGDLLCITCSFFFALHIVLTERVVKEHDPILVTIIQLVLISIYALTIAGLFMPSPQNISKDSLYALIFMGLFGTAMAFLLQNICQQKVSPEKLGIIFSLEPITGMVSSFLLIGDVIPIISIVGGFVVVLALIASETNLRKLRKGLIERL